jgi:hypothetical protein
MTCSYKGETNMKSYILGLSFAGLLCFTLTPTLRASVANQKARITFSAPIQVPGTVLPAGTYTFRLLPSKGGRNIVEIFNGTHLDATTLTATDKTLHPTGKTILKFAKTAPGSPEVLRAWFYPGDTYGHQFIYPHDEAVKLAKANNVTVFATPSDLTPYIKESFTSDQDADAQKMESSPLVSVQPSGKDDELPPNS